MAVSLRHAVTPRLALERLRTSIRAAGLGTAAVAALILAAGQVAAVGSEVAVVSWSFHTANHQSVTSVPVGTDVHFKIDVDGIAGTPTGQARIRIYPTTNCTNLARSVDLPLVAGSVDGGGFDVTRNDAGSVSYQVQYLGDATYATSLGECKVLTFTKVTPFIELRIHDSEHDQVDTVPFTRTVHGWVEVEGPAGDPGNWVLFRSWTNATCTGEDYEFTTVNVENNVADPGLPLGFDAPGDVRSYKARYSGDNSYNAVWSECVAVAATKANVSLQFGIHLANHNEYTDPVLVGTPIHAWFGVTGSGGQPTGQVTVRMYNDIGCNVLLQTHFHAAGAFVDESDFALSARATPGIIAWAAEYEGDSKYNAKDTGCVPAHYQAKPSVALAIHNGSHNAVTSVVSGTTVHLRAAVSSDFGTPIGKVNLRRSANAICSDSTLLGGANLSGGVLHDASIDFKPTSAGSYYFKAIYKGDDDHVEASSSCIKLTVTAPPTPTTAPTAAPTAAPTTAPTTPPDPTAAPVATGEPVASAEPSVEPSIAAPSVEPTSGSEPTAAPTQAVAGSTSAPQTSAGPNATPTPTTPAPSSGEGFPSWMLIVAVLVVIAAAVGYWASGRRRRA